MIVDVERLNVMKHFFDNQVILRCSVQDYSKGRDTVSVHRVRPNALIRLERVPSRLGKCQKRDKLLSSISEICQ